MPDLTRREALQGLALVGIGAGAVGTAGAARPQRYVVGTSSPAAVRAARSGAASVGHVLDFGAVGGAVSGHFPQEALEGLARRPDVRYVEAVAPVQAISIDATGSEYRAAWGVDRVDAKKAHDTTTGSDTVDLAIIDTGIDTDHPDLPPLGSGVAYLDGNGTPSTTVEDDNGHGTHCAGIAAAVHDGTGVVGVAPDVTLHPVKVLGSDGSGDSDDVAAGIAHVADRGWQVGSLSLGSRWGSAVIQDACQYAYGAGVLLVAAAGNDGPRGNSVSYPGAYGEVVAVSATDRSDSIPRWSSTGPEVELAAPGAGIYSTVPGGDYATKSGTSMACPHVAGAGALLMGLGQDNVAARDLLSRSAEDLGLKADDQGAGLLDAERAVALAGATGGDTNPVVATGDATDVTETSATLHGSLEDLGGAASADVSFEWGEVGAGFPNRTPPETLTATGAFSAAVDGLTAGTDYEFRAAVVASDGDAATGSTGGFTTATSGGSGGANAPVVDRHEVTEAGSKNPHADITSSWSVSDVDGDLRTVRVEVVGEGVAAETPVSGGAASGTTDLQVKFGGGGTYDVRLTVTDAAGHETTDTKQVTAA